MRFLIILVVSLAFVCALLGAVCAEDASASNAPQKIFLDESCFAPSVIVDGRQVGVRGLSLFEYWKFSVYTAAFYAAPEIDTIEKAFGPVPKYLTARKT